MKKLKSYIQDNNDFLKKITNLSPLPDDLILCTIDVLGFCPNMPHEEKMISIKKAINTSIDQIISTSSLIKLAE